MMAPRSPTQQHRQLALISPRNAITVTEIEPPLDFSFYNMASLQETLDTEPRPSVKATNKQRDSSKPSKSKCLKLNNNCLSEISELRTVASQLFADADEVAWLDLSFNELTKVDDILLTFPNLQILYLHGNQIGDMKEVEKLAKISTLKKLSLHGNPVENEKGYKYQFMALLPTVQTLDFSRVTKADRKTAATLEVMNKNVKRGKRKPKEED